MNKLLRSGFILFAIVLAGLFFLEATGSLVSGVFPLALWFWLTVLFGGAAIATQPKTSTEPWWSWTTIALVTLFTLLLVVYAVANAWRFGPFGILLVVVAAVLPVVIARSVMNANR